MERNQNERRILSHLIGEPGQTVVEGTALLPMGMPEMERIIQLVPYAQITMQEAEGDRVSLGGEVTVLICYLCKDNLTHAYESTSPFQAVVDLPQAKKGMDVLAEALPAALEYRLVNGRELGLTVTVDLCCTVEHEIPLVAMGVEEAPKDACVLPREVHFTRSAGRMKLTGEIEGSIPIPAGIPAVERVLYATGFAQCKQAVFNGEQLVISGELKLSVLYTTGEESAPISSFCGTLEFHEEMDASDLDGDIEVRAQVGKIYCELDEAGDALKISALCRMAVCSRRRFGFVGIGDAYGIQKEVELQTASIHAAEQCISRTAAGAIRERMPLGDSPVPSRVLACALLPAAARAYGEDGVLVLEGMLSCQVTYLGYDGGIYMAMGEVPLRLREPGVDLGDAQTLLCRICPEQVQAVPVGDEVEIRALVSYSCEGFRGIHTTLVTGMEVLDTPAADAVPPGILVYFVQPGDTLWDVAKRYRIHKDVIKNQNGDVEERLQPGQKLLLLLRPEG
ncbi:MAG: DUF3794 domain-containing protein [Clostridiales bacterium]|nr:DUF3794 domain-containing protein [Clostridiales bacterium]